MASANNAFQLSQASTPHFMNVQEQIKACIASQPEPKRSDMQEVDDIPKFIFTGYCPSVIKKN